ncbi:MAG: DUF2589 domain-containing protein [Fibrobacter sp.]|nr:DUF2589 domain-containing protein [Fibrobacter sp.]
MAVDSTPATTVQNMLNGIDYSALIGGPLQAAVSAQAMAAKSTWEFIQEVGLNTDKQTGMKSAVNVTFIYQKDGELTKLIVPLLTIVPIPMIVIDDVSIQFKASLNASSSECTETASSESIEAGGEGSAKVGWGPFSLTVRAKANYSSKKDSKSTKDSRYSVEYTQDVSVHATQADMPAGLATVLNILSSSATPNVNAQGNTIESNKNTIAPTKDNPEVVSIGVKNSDGLYIKGAKVVIEAQYAQSAQNKDKLKAYLGHLEEDVILDGKTEYTLDDGFTNITFKVEETMDPAIVTVTYVDPKANAVPAQGGSVPTTTTQKKAIAKIMVSKYTVSNP